MAHRYSLRPRIGVIPRQLLAMLRDCHVCACSAGLRTRYINCWKRSDLAKSLLSVVKVMFARQSPRHQRTSTHSTIICLHSKVLLWRRSIQPRQRRISCGVSPSLHNTRHETKGRLSRRMLRGRVHSAKPAMTSALQLAELCRIDNTAKASKAKTLIPSEHLTEHIITMIRCKRERSIIRHFCEMIRESPRCGRWDAGIAGEDRHLYEIAMPSPAMCIFLYNSVMIFPAC